MTAAGFADYEHHRALSHGIKPARKEVSACQTGAHPYLIRASQGLSAAVPMLREQIGVALLDVLLPLRCQFNVALEIGAGKPGHHNPPQGAREFGRYPARPP